MDSPYSPQPDPGPYDPLKATAHLLDSLVTFYQDERMWVYRTRAMLEDAFLDSPDTPSPGGSNYPGYNTHHTIPSHMPSSMNSQPYPIPDSESRPDNMHTRWNRRKKGFKMRLDGLQRQRNRRVLSTPSERQPADDPREQILVMFEKMMEARMESCQRVNRLVRASLQYR